MQRYDKERFGKIHSFESMGAVDGPGIRYVIFMQGCHLKCKYCQNRDTWECNKGELYDIQEITDKILHYKNYIVPNGGVTISGGEPILQVKFLINLFKNLKKEGIHTAIDTSGSFEITQDIKDLINLTDLFLLDIKSINDDICKELCGISNKKELEFARYLSDVGKDMWIRQVLIPGYTDFEEDLEHLKKFIKSLKTVKKIEVLGYHNLGKFKWEKLGLKYELEDVKTASREDIERAKRILGI